MRSLIRRAAGYLVVIWAVVTAAFFGLRFGRVDPVSALSAQGMMAPDQVAAIRASLGLDRPVLDQYAAFLGDSLQGRFGTSLFSGQPVNEMLGMALAYTLPLAAVSWMAALVLGILFGAAASHRGDYGLRGWVGRWISPLLSVGAALPVALTGLVVLWLAVPVVGAISSDALREALRFGCAVAVLAVNVGFALGRVAESTIRERRREPFYITLRARGFPEGLGMDWRLLRTGIAPLLALAGMEAAFLLGGTMVVETVFARPGFGRMAVEAMLRGDYPVVQAALGFAAAAYCLMGLVADGLAILLDPRLRGTS